MPMPGEKYIQVILDQLNGIEVKGSENLTRMFTAIRMLETLKKDIVEHKQQPAEEMTEEL